MDDRDLVRAIEALERAADDGTLADNRTRALKAYRGENTNPAPDGRSQIVDRTIYDVAEAVKGPVLKLFLSGDEVVRFTPRGPEDIQAADQESAFINYVLTEKNDAFNVFSGWLHDALIQKNGYVIARWKEEERTALEQYEDLTDDEYAALMQADDIEVVEDEISDDSIPGDTRHDVKLRRTREYGYVCVENVPPESVLVDPNLTTVSLANAGFVARREHKTLSELRDMGFDVADDLSDSGENRHDWEEETRRLMSGQLHDEDTEPDPSMRRVWVREVWIRYDHDGDGKAELRHVIVVGTTVLENEEAEFIPLVAFSGKPLPHQHYGESFYDEAREIQDVKTALIRGVLDAIYLGNAPRFAANLDRANLDDLLESRPGGIVRTEGDPMGAIMPLTTPMNPAPAMSMLEYMDVVRETRTGVTRVGTGLDPNALNKTASGIAMLQGAQSQRIELIARHFAESVKELCLLVHALTLKHSRQPELVLLRNQWVPVDPRQWSMRKDMSISVGLGTGNRQEQSAFLMQMLQLALGPGAQMGFSTPDKVFAMLSKLTNAAGFKNAEEFWADPSKRPPQPPQQPPPDPKLIEVQAKAQSEQAKLQMQAQGDAAKMQQEAQLQQQKLAAQMELERLKAEQDAALARYKADLDAQVALEVARIRSTADMARMQQQHMGMGNGLS